MAESILVIPGLTTGGRIMISDGGDIILTPATEGVCGCCHPSQCHTSCAQSSGVAAGDVTAWKDGADDPTICCIPNSLLVEIAGPTGSGCGCFKSYHAGDLCLFCTKATGDILATQCLQFNGSRMILVAGCPPDGPFTWRVAYSYTGWAKITGSGRAISYEARPLGTVSECTAPVVCDVPLKNTYMYVEVLLFPPDGTHASWGMSVTTSMCAFPAYADAYGIGNHMWAPAPLICNPRVPTGPTPTTVLGAPSIITQVQDISPCQDEYNLDFNSEVITFDLYDGNVGELYADQHVAQWAGGTVTVRTCCSFNPVGGQCDVICDPNGQPKHKWYPLRNCTGDTSNPDNLYIKDDNLFFGSILKIGSDCYLANTSATPQDTNPGTEAQPDEVFGSCSDCTGSWFEAYDCIDGTATGKYAKANDVAGTVGTLLVWSWPDPSHPCVKFPGPEISTPPDEADVLEPTELHANCKKCGGYVQALECGTGEALDAWTAAINVETLGSVGETDTGPVYEVIVDGDVHCVYYGLPEQFAGGTISDPIAEHATCSDCTGAGCSPCTGTNSPNANVTLTFSSATPGESTIQVSSGFGGGFWSGGTGGFGFGIDCGGTEFRCVFNTPLGNSYTFKKCQNGDARGAYYLDSYSGASADPGASLTVS